MKKLGKKFVSGEETIEAYVCPSCMCTCSCDACYGCSDLLNNWSSVSNKNHNTGANSENSGVLHGTGF